MIEYDSVNKLLLNINGQFDMNKHVNLTVVYLSLHRTKVGIQYYKKKNVKKDIYVKLNHSSAE